MDYRNHMSREELVQFYNEMDDVKKFLQKNPGETVHAFARKDLSPERMTVRYGAMKEVLGSEYSVEWLDSKPGTIAIRLQDPPR